MKAQPGARKAASGGNKGLQRIHKAVASSRRKQREGRRVPALTQDLIEKVATLIRKSGRMD